MPTRDGLLIGEWAVLALICEQPAHGYAIAAAMAPSGEIGRIWSLTQALTYRALDVLQQRELARVSNPTAGGVTSRRVVLEPTSGSRDLVSEWLATPVEHIRDLRSILLLKLAFRERAGLPLSPLLEPQLELVREKAPPLAARAASGDLADLWRSTMAGAATNYIEQVLERERRMD